MAHLSKKAFFLIPRQTLVMKHKNFEFFLPKNSCVVQKTTIFLNSSLCQNDVAWKTHAFWAIFDNVFYVKCCDTKNSRFLNHFFTAKCCSTKNSHFLKHFLLPNVAAQKTHIFWNFCGENVCSMNHFKHFLAPHLLSKEVVQKCM